MRRATKPQTISPEQLRLYAFIAATAIVAILAIGGYFFNWTWTGFSGNTLWDWLELLVLPVALASVTIWYSRGAKRWRTEWIALAVGLGVLLVILAIGGYALNWTWTGFSGNTFWDWMKLLLLPLTLTTASVWFGSQQDKPK